MRGDDLDGVYSSGYNDGFADGEKAKEEARHRGFEEGWDAAIRYVEMREEYRRKQKRAMCGRILNGE